MSEIDFDKFNQTIKGLPELAMQMAPTDKTIPFLANLLPVTVTKQNARDVMTVMALICRKMSVIFNDLAAEQERLVQEWRD